jgi:hypothetical protein
MLPSTTSKRHKSNKGNSRTSTGVIADAGRSTVDSDFEEELNEYIGILLSVEEVGSTYALYIFDPSPKLSKLFTFIAVFQRV